jgi:hypothetical protein
LCEFEFIFAAVALGEILGLLRGLTTKLQCKSIDLISAYNDIELVCDGVQDMRTNILEVHSKLFQKASDLADLAGVDVKKPRTCRKQRHRANAHSDSIEDHFRVNGPSFPRAKNQIL